MKLRVRVNVRYRTLRAQVVGDGRVPAALDNLPARCLFRFPDASNNYTATQQTMELFIYCAGRSYLCVTELVNNPVGYIELSLCGGWWNGHNSKESKETERAVR